MKKYLVFYCLMVFGTFASDVLNLNMGEAIEQAYYSNKLIKKSEIDLNTSDLQVRQAFKSGLPSLTLNSNWSEIDSKLNRDSGFSQQLVLNQPIFQGFQILEGVKSSKNLRNLSELQIEASKKEVRLAVIEAYLDILRLDEQIQVLNASIEEFSKNLTKLERMKVLGMVTETDLLDLELEKIKLESSLVQVQNAKSIKELDFKNKVGIKQSQKIALSPNKDIYIKLENIDYDRDLRYTLENNINIEMANINKDLTKSKERIDKAKLLPNVAFQGTYGTKEYQENFSDSLDTDNFAWTVGINFSWNVFTFGSNIDGVNIARNNIEKANLDLESTREEIELLLKSTYLNIINLENQVKLSERALERSEKNYDLQKKKYEQQMISSIEFLGAENNLRTAKFNLIDAKISLYYTYHKYLSIRD